MTATLQNPLIRIRFTRTGTVIKANLTNIKSIGVNNLVEPNQNYLNGYHNLSEADQYCIVSYRNHDEPWQY